MFPFLGPSTDHALLMTKKPERASRGVARVDTGGPCTNLRPAFARVNRKASPVCPARASEILGFPYAGG